MSDQAVLFLEVTKLRPHPRNPRFVPREEVVEQIAAQLIQAKTFDPAHALIVRPLGDAYQIIAGHHRILAAQRAGILTVPCWVREMSDADAYMALVLDNAQSELLPLEEGMHALLSEMSGSEYARQAGCQDTSNGVFAPMRRQGRTGSYYTCSNAGYARPTLQKPDRNSCCPRVALGGVGGHRA